MYKPHKKSRRPLLTFERLEDRLVFSSSELAIPSLGGLTGPGSLDPDSQPPLTPTNAIALDSNWKPLVYAGQDISTTLGNTVLLNGEIISNTNQGLTIQWRLLSGPGTTTITNANTANASATFSVAGVYEFELAVSNDFASAIPARVSVVVNAAASSLPALPELFDTTYSLPTGGTTRYVNAGGNFQAALDAAVAGDVIVLQAGATFTGNFTLPKKVGNGWIYIISSQLSQLPDGERVGLQQAQLMPKLVAGNVQIPTLRTDFGAHHYRIAGIEVVTNEAKLDLIRTGYGIPAGGTVWNLERADTVAELPHHITFDRMLIHSTSNTNSLRHGIMLNGQYMAVVNSYIANVKDTADAQAIFIHNGDGPYKIVNNFLEATGENFMAGGTDPAISGSIPSDIEFRGNHLFKRLDWKTNDLWGVKNLFELKNAERVLISGNIMENCWTDAQNGTGVVFTVRNQNGTAPWSVVQDINFENNIVKNVGIGISITGEDDLQASQQTKRVRIHNNVFENVTGDYCVGPKFLVLGIVNRPILNLTVSHNTFLSALDESGPQGHIVFASDGINVDGFVLKDNIMVHGSFHPVWSRVTNADITNNMLIMMPGDYRYAWNKSNFNTQHPGWLMADPGFGAVGFVDYANGNYRLAPGSAFTNKASDGTDPGVRFDELMQALNGVASGALGLQSQAPTIDSSSSIMVAQAAAGFDNVLFNSNERVVWTEQLARDRARKKFSEPRLTYLVYPTSVVIGEAAPSNGETIEVRDAHDDPDDRMAAFNHIFTSLEQYVNDLKFEGIACLVL